MKIRLFLAVAAFASFIPAASAETDDPMYTFGAETCGRVLDGDVDGIAGAPYRDAIAAAGQDRAAFCGCVGAGFRDNHEAQAAEIAAAGDNTAAVTEAFNRILVRNLEACLTASDEVTDGDLQDADQAYQIDPEDERMCRLALAGDLPIPGLDAAEVTEGYTTEGRTDEEFCGCVAAKIAMEGEEARAAVESAANPMQAYLGQLGAAIEACR